VPTTNPYMNVKEHYYILYHKNLNLSSFFYFFIPFFQS
jgi:hypothetical protein